MSKVDLYWIDDSLKHMMSLADTVFPMLWDVGFSCVSILFGNAYCAKEDERGPSEEDSDALCNFIENKFYGYCQDLDRHNWEELGTTYEKKKDLLVRPAVKVVPLGRHSNEDTKMAIEMVSQNWMNNNTIKSFQTELITEPLDKALSKFQMSIDVLLEEMAIPDGTPIALDIYLLHGDGDRIKNNQPTLSMILYKVLSSTHPCYLYSEMAVSQTLVDQWKCIYRTLFSTSDFDVYPKFGLITNQTETEAKRSLVKMLEDARRNGNVNV